MKFKSYLFSFLIVLVLTVLFSYGPQDLFAEENQEQARKQIIEMMIKMNPNMKDKIRKLTGLADQILEDNEQLRNYFQKRKFKEMAELYGKRGAVLVTQKYERICGKDSAIFWCEAWKPMAVLQFKTINVFLNDVTEKEGEEKFDCIAYVVNEVHLIYRKEGRILRNATFTDSRAYRHRYDCWWSY